ncbi:MAG: hypothetical protein PHV62_01565 [Sulfuricurvum sp.]|nr:hypothetical protein [Sulfuricurvum sp.]
MYSKSLLCSLLLCTVTYSDTLNPLTAQQNGTASGELSWLTTHMDELEQYLSKKVRVVSSNIDRLFSEDNDTNITQEGNYTVAPKRENDNCKPPLDEEKEAFLVSTGFSDFFKDETYLDITNRSYVKLHGGYEYNEKGDSGIFHGVTARLRLPKTQKQLQLFIGSEPDNIKGLNNTAHQDNGVGLKYYMNSLYQGLFAHASIGIAGITNPYVKTNVEYPLYFENWLLRPIQTFKYSARDKFDEWTDLYFDRKISNTEMIRLLLERSTNSEIKGMNYLSQLSYFNAYREDISCSYYVGMNGRTKDLVDTTYINTLHPQEGVYDYSVGVTWRQRLWKDYVFYQVDPLVSFHEQYNYRPNYIFRIGVDIYFGNNK